MSPRLLERLHGHQAQILAIIDDKAPLLDADGPHDVAGLARARWSMVRALTAYSLFKHHEIFDPMIAAADPADLPHWQRNKQACLDLGDEFRAYVRKWSAADVAARWDEYRPAARRMIARIRDHMARERIAFERR